MSILIILSGTLGLLVVILTILLINEMRYSNSISSLLMNNNKVEYCIEEIEEYLNEKRIPEIEKELNNVYGDSFTKESLNIASIYFRKGYLEARM